MKVWWCEEHDAQQTAIEPLLDGIRGACWKKHTFAKYLSTPCRMVEMQLVPADALVVVKENGGWPEWITDVDGPIWYQCGSTYGLLDDIVEAIAERAKSLEEPPKDPWDYDP